VYQNVDRQIRSELQTHKDLMTWKCQGAEILPSHLAADSTSLELTQARLFASKNEAKQHQSTIT
jgi:hypothetical protein